MESKIYSLREKQKEYEIFKEKHVKNIEYQEQSQFSKEQKSDEQENIDEIEKLRSMLDRIKNSNPYKRKIQQWKKVP